MNNEYDRESHVIGEIQRNGQYLFYDEYHKKPEPKLKNVEPQYTVTCPYCKSPNCKKINNFGKLLSIEFWGLSSSKIGKQWICKNCNSYF